MTILIFRLKTNSIETHVWYTFKPWRWIVSDIERRTRWILTSRKIDIVPRLSAAFSSSSSFIWLCWFQIMWFCFLKRKPIVLSTTRQINRKTFNQILCMKSVWFIFFNPHIFQMILSNKIFSFIIAALSRRKYRCFSFDDLSLSVLSHDDLTMEKFFSSELLGDDLRVHQFSYGKARSIF